MSRPGLPRLPGSLRARLLVLVALAMLPALALIIVMNVEDRRERKARAYDEAARVVRLGADAEGRQVAAAEQLLRDLSHLPEIWAPRQPECSATLRELFPKLRGYYHLGIVRPDGTLACTTRTQQEPINFADREWFQRALAARELVVIGMARGMLNGGLPVVIVAVPMVDEGAVQGVAYASLQMAWFTDFAREARLGRGATLTVITARGAILAHDPEPPHWGSHDEFAAPLVHHIVKTQRGTLEHRDRDGVDRLYAFAPLLSGSSSTMYLAIGLPQADAFAGANRALTRNLVMLAFTAAVAFAAAWSAGTRLVMNAVRALLAATQRLGDGQLATRVPVPAHGGELAQLARAFNEMAEGLERRDAALSAAAAARKVTEVRLQWATIAETSSDAIVGVARDDTIFSWNAGAEAQFAYAAADVVGRRFADLVSPRLAPEVDVAFARVRCGDRVNDAEFTVISKDGHEVPVSCTLSLISDPTGGVLGVSVIARDMTERRLAEAKLRVQSAALEAAANGIVITAADGTIEWVNEAFTTMTGYAAAESVGQTPRILKSDRHDAAFYAEMWRTVKAGRVWGGQVVNRRKDGTLYDEAQTITPVLDDQGVIAHFVAIKQDVTEQRRADERLRRSEEHFRSLIENALDMILVIDADGITRYASPSVERVIGLRPDELVGRSGFAHVHPADVVALRALFAHGARRPGFTASTEYRFAHRDGSWRTLEAVGRSLVGDSGVAGVVVNARDITDRKEAEEVQRRLESQLAQAEKLAAMGNLLAGVAHELNNPLSVVIGHTALLEESFTGTSQGARAAKIGHAAQRCARIVKNFLALARQYAPERTRVDLAQLARETLEMLAYQLRVDAVELVLDLPADLPPVAVDRHQIQQVLVNLVTNAHHALREVPSGRRLTISVRLEPAARCARLVVADTGSGMTPEVRQRLFEPFFTTKAVGQGTGLGLSICKGIVESHGGRIEVGVGDGRGATFTVTLPVAAAETPAAPMVAMAAPRRCRVLVVDDEPDVLSVLTEMLTGDGHTVETAGNGEEALGKIESGATYDVIMSDVKMPGLDGPALYRAVAERRPELCGRFMFVTGDTLSVATARFLEETAVPSLHKPFNYESTRAALAKLLAALDSARGRPGPTWGDAAPDRST